MASRVEILTPKGGIWESPVPIRFVLFDDKSRMVRIEVAYSNDNGATFRAATETDMGASEGTEDLAASPTGVTHLFVWDAAVDLGMVQPGMAVIRITPYSEVMGRSDTCSLRVGGFTELPVIAAGERRIGRKDMTAEERRMVSERMRKYWASRRRPGA